VPIGVPCNLACYRRCLLPGLCAVCERWRQEL